MKRKDWVLIAVVVFVSGAISYVLSNFLFGGDKNRQTQVEVVQAITTEFPAPSEKHFNSKSINPTQIIRIGDSNNDSPFNQ